LIREYEEKLRALSLSGPGTSDIDELSRLRLKLADVEAANRNNSELYEQEKKTSESLRLLLKLKEGEQLPPANSVTDEVIRRMLIDYENKNVMFMIEIERLGRIVGELQMENDRLIAKLSQNDLKSSLQTIDTDKYLLQNQIRDYKIRLEELEHQLLVTRQDLERARSGQQGGTGANSALIMEIERINGQLREKDLRIKDLEEGLRVRSSGEQVKRSVLPDEGIRGVNKRGIFRLITVD